MDKDVEVKGVVSIWLCSQLVAAPEIRTLSKAGGMHPTGMLCYFLIEIGCYDLFLEIHVIIVLYLELLGEEDWDSVVKYRHVNKEKKWNECQVGNQFLSSIFSSAWTPSVCKFTRKMSKFQQNEHTPTLYLWDIYFKTKMMFIINIII